MGHPLSLFGFQYELISVDRQHRRHTGSEFAVQQGFGNGCFGVPCGGLLIASCAVFPRCFAIEKGQNRIIDGKRDGACRKLFCNGGQL